MAKVVLIASGKGGVGKTTFAINLSVGLKLQNHSVLLIDGNLRKPNLSMHLDTKFKYSLHDVMQTNINPMNSISKHPSGVSVIFGSNDENEILQTNVEKYSRMLNYLDTTAKDLDFIIIDSPSNFSPEFFWSARHADETILVTTSSKDSLEDAKKTIQYCEDYGAHVVGVVVNELNPSLFRGSIKAVERELNKKVFGHLPFEKKMQNAIDIKHPITLSYPNRRISGEIRNIAKFYSSLNIG